MRLGVMAVASFVLVTVAGAAHGEQGKRGLPATMVATKERAIGYCLPSAYKRSASHDVVTGLSPGSVAADYFHLYENRKVDPESASRVEVLVSPKHGMVAPLEGYPIEYDYVPDPGYVGNDKVVLRVYIDRTMVRIVYLLKVTDRGGEDSSPVRDDLCKKTGIRWKISLPTE